MQLNGFQEELDKKQAELYRILALPVKSRQDFWNNVDYISQEMKYFNNLPKTGSYLKFCNECFVLASRNMKDYIERSEELLKSRDLTLRLFALERLCANMWTTPIEYIDQNSDITDEDLITGFERIPWNCDLALLAFNNFQEIKRIDGELIDKLANSQL